MDAVTRVLLCGRCWPCRISAGPAGAIQGRSVLRRGAQRPRRAESRRAPVRAERTPGASGAGALRRRAGGRPRARIATGTPGARVTAPQGAADARGRPQPGFGFSVSLRVLRPGRRGRPPAAGLSGPSRTAARARRAAHLLPGCSLAPEHRRGNKRGRKALARPALSVPALSIDAAPERGVLQAIDSPRLRHPRVRLLPPRWMSPDRHRLGGASPALPNRPAGISVYSPPASPDWLVQTRGQDLGHRPASALYGADSRQEALAFPTGRSRSALLGGPVDPEKTNPPDSCAEEPASASERKLGQMLP